VTAGALSGAEPHRLVTHTCGRGTQRVVFVHGVLDRGRSFDRVAAELDRECEMVWYDRRGYGDSADAPGAPVQIQGHVEDLVSVLDGLPAVVVGHSFGGVTVAATAIRVPELVRSVVLYETGMAWLPGWDDTSLQAFLWGDDPETAGLRLMFRDRFDTMAAEELDRRRREARAFVVEERDVRGGARPFDISELKVPLVYGHSGAHSFPAVADHLREALPEVEIVLFPGAGHNAHRSQPGPFADMVRLGLVLASESTGGA